MHNPHFARRGFTSHFGKMTQFGTLRLGTDTAELARREAAKLRLPPMEFLRALLEQTLHGRSAIEHAHTVRLDAIDHLVPPQYRKEPPTE